MQAIEHATPVPELTELREEREVAYTGSHDIVEVVSGPRIRRVELRLLQAQGGVILRGRCWPAWPGAEVEVAANARRVAALLADDGTFEIRGLPAGTRHANVVVRGPGAPAICVLKLPVE